jgi:excisionase family DNA binding protein
MPSRVDVNTTLTLRQAAKRLNVHHATLRRWIIDGEGPHTFVKPGRARSTYRITIQSLEDFIRRNSRGGG